MHANPPGVTLLKSRPFGSEFQGMWLNILQFNKVLHLNGWVKDTEPSQFCSNLLSTQDLLGVGHSFLIFFENITIESYNYAGSHVGFLRQ